MSFYEQQAGALCFRRAENEAPKVLLITSRENKRWVIPKGWPKNGEEFDRAAAREAFEEAGVKGAVQGKALGDYVYAKRRPTLILPVKVFVYPLCALKIKRYWPEADQRERRWFPIDLAAEKVIEPELAALIREFARVTSPYPIDS
jgi:8-oxo-dGTP pyrophosphatase MutT (NUDIX family)